MARIMKTTPKESTVEQIFNLYICSVTSEGVKGKTITTYKQHFHAISKRLDVSIPISTLTSNRLDKMIQRMKDEELSPRSINSYTRTLKVLFSWCNQEGYTDLNITINKAAEAVKETYTDEELLILLEKPKADCNLCEYRNWVILNFLLNSGCRAATVRNIQNQDVDLSRKQIVLRHTKNGTATSSMMTSSRTMNSVLPLHNWPKANDKPSRSKQKRSKIQTRILLLFNIF